LQPVARIESLETTGVAGAGWHRYPELLHLNADRISQVVDVQFPRASFLLGSGAALLREGAITAAADLVPDYVRAKVASSPDEARGRSALQASLSRDDSRLAYAVARGREPVARGAAGGGTGRGCR